MRNLEKSLRFQSLLEKMLMEIFTSEVFVSKSGGLGQARLGAFLSFFFHQQISSNCDSKHKVSSFAMQGRRPGGGRIDSD